MTKHTEKDSQKLPLSKSEFDDDIKKHPSLAKEKPELKPKSASSLEKNTTKKNTKVEELKSRSSRVYSCSLSRTPSPFLKKNEKIQLAQSAASSKTIEKQPKKPPNRTSKCSSDDSDSSSSGAGAKKRKKYSSSENESSDDASQRQAKDKYKTKQLSAKEHSSTNTSKNKQMDGEAPSGKKLKSDTNTTVKTADTLNVKSSSKTVSSRKRSIPTSDYSDDNLSEPSDKKKSKLSRKVSDDSSSDSEADEKRKKLKKHKKHSKKHKKHKKRKKRSKLDKENSASDDDDEQAPSFVNEDLEKQLRERALKSMKKQNSTSD